MRSAHYQGPEDGDIKDYLVWGHDNGIVAPTFKGYEPFKQLWDMGVVIPEIAMVRLKYGMRSDECYVVKDKDNVEGMELEAHSGHKGIFNTKELLSTTDADNWEALGLMPTAFRR